MSESKAGAPTRLGTLLLTMAAGIAVLAGMRIAAPILGPVLIALMLTIAWTPGSDWLRRHGWKPSIAALMGIVVGIVVIGLFFLLVYASLIQLQDKLPGYQPRVEAIQQMIREKLSDLPIDSSRFFTSEFLQPGSIISYGLTTIRRVTETAGIILLLVLLMAFMMLEATRYPGKLKYALGSRSAAIERLTLFGETIRGYVVVNAVFGAVAAAINTTVLLVVGVDFAFLWGVVSFLLSFVPNVGFLIALVPPMLMALIEYGFTTAIVVAVAYIVINFVVDNIIKPRFVGSTVNLSPLVVVLSLIFWGWLLGPMGALVAIPLSIGARFFFETFDESMWIARMMSDEGPKPVVLDVEPDAKGASE